MTLNDFSNGFDTLVNSYATSGTFGDTMPDVRFDEYEKSLYLTKYQEELIISLYNGKNPYGDSFEKTEELRRYLSNLVVVDTVPLITNASGHPVGMEGKNSYFFSLPSENKPDVWFITYESVILSDTGENPCKDGATMEVYPVRQDEYHKIRKNPFRGANDRRALRLDLADGVIEIVCKYGVSQYYVRYLRKPKPIILVDLADGVTIEGESTATTKLDVHEALHQRILEGAVMMALQSKGYKFNNENK